jgi:hypothetical protein
MERFRAHEKEFKKK